VQWIGEGAHHLQPAAVLSGAVPSLTSIELSLRERFHMHFISGDWLRLFEKVRVTATREYFDGVDHGQQIAALEYLRRLPHLRDLHLECYRGREVTFPPFIPASLKTLRIDVHPAATLETLLRELPLMLQGSEARLEEFYLHFGDDWSRAIVPAEVGAALAGVLQACSSTLKILRLRKEGKCPWDVFSALPTTCPTFPRLAEVLTVLPGGAIDMASPAWDVMASGRLPALATFKIDSDGELSWLPVDEWEGGEGRLARAFRKRLARAFEAVGGSLKRLTFLQRRPSRGHRMPTGAWYELGTAIGKLRNLRYLHVDLFTDGRDLRDVGQGMAASGGCPQLSEILLHHIESNLDCVAYKPSLIVPSVRDLSIWGCGTEEEVLLCCCGLVQMGPMHRLVKADLSDPRAACLDNTVHACVRAILESRGGMT
jgi:hypothetical protein